MVKLLQTMIKLGLHHQWNSVAGAYRRRSGNRREAIVLIVSVDGGCRACQRQDGTIGATSRVSFADVSLGIEAMRLGQGRTKPAQTKGKPSFGHGWRYDKRRAC